jgi:hypothetical protein
MVDRGLRVKMQDKRMYGTTASDLAKRSATKHRNTEIRGRRNIDCRLGSTRPENSQPAPISIRVAAIDQDAVRC